MPGKWISSGPNGIRCRAKIAVFGLLLLSALAAAQFLAAPAAASPPTVLVIDPGNGDTLQGTVTARGTAGSTEVGRLVIRVDVRVDSGEWILASGTTTWSYRLRTESLDDGWHTLTVKAYDGTEYSEAKGVEFRTNNAVSGGDSGVAVLCLVVTVVMIAIMVPLFALFWPKAGRADGVPQGVVPSMRPGYPSYQYYQGQVDRPMNRPYPATYHHPASPRERVLQYRPEPAPAHLAGRRNGAEEIYVLQAVADEAVTVDQWEGGGKAPASVEDHADATVHSPGGLDIDDAAGPYAQAGPAAFPEVAAARAPPETIEVVEMSPGVQAEPPAARPGRLEMPAGPEPPASGDGRRDRIIKALATMPRGIPMPLLGIPMNELAGMIMTAGSEVSPTGAELVRLKGRWYHADETDIGKFMVEYKR